MNIVFLHSVGINPFAGGISRMTSVLSDGLKKKGVEVFYLSMIKIKNARYDENQYFFPKPEIPSSDENRKFIIQFVTEKNIDILINQATTSSVFSDLSYYVKPFGVKIISVIHNSLLTPIINFPDLKENKIIDLGLSFVLPFIRNKLFILILKNLYRLKYQRHYRILQKESNRIVMVSKSNIPEFLYMVNTNNRGNVMSINNAFSLNDYEYCEHDKKKEVLWVGTPDFSIKRLDLALRIWSLIEENNSDWHLTVLGDSPSLEKAKKLAKNLNLSTVNFEGRQDPIEYYKRASFLMMTSTTESFGLVLIEAMHFGVVPFSFDSFPASRDIIENEKDGVLINSFDLELYADKLIGLMRDAERKQLMMFNCMKKSKEFDINTIINQWMLLFNKI